jgi:hypothetical protein
VRQPTGLFDDACNTLKNKVKSAIAALVVIRFCSLDKTPT